MHVTSDRVISFWYITWRRLLQPHSRSLSLLSRTHPSAVKEHLCGIRPLDATFENDIWCSVWMKSGSLVIMIHFGNKEWITRRTSYGHYSTLASKFNIFQNIRLAKVQTRELCKDTMQSYKLTQNRTVLETRKRTCNWC